MDLLLTLLLFFGSQGIGTDRPYSHFDKMVVTKDKEQTEIVLTWDTDDEEKPIKKSFP